jgi:GntR family transcriptional regulator
MASRSGIRPAEKVSRAASGKEGQDQSDAQGGDRSCEQHPLTPTLSSLSEQGLGLGHGGVGIPGYLVEALVDQSCRHGTTMTRTMLPVNVVDRSQPVALHDQVAAEIRRAIAEGEASPGERLPLAKDIAAVLGVNKNTVLRAMHILRDEGLVTFGRGSGITVCGTPEQGALVTRIQELLAFARSQGYQRDAVIAMIQTLP